MPVGLRAEDRRAPPLTLLERVYHYAIVPIYTVFPKPGELDNIVSYLLTEQETVAATPLPGESFSFRDQLSVIGWSRDGQYLAYKARTRGRPPEIRVVSSKDGQTRVLQPDFNYLSSVHWSPDGKSIYLCAGNHTLPPQIRAQRSELTGYMLIGTSRAILSRL
jgi:dipeptidyl aminopeptidase/acylaminoacyl peptidase